MSLGASLTWNNFRTKFFFSNGFRELKGTVLHSGKKWEKSLQPFSRKSQKSHAWPLFPDFKKIEIFLKHSVYVIFSPILSPKFMQKIRKILRADSEKKMLITNGLTDNTEFITPSPSVVQFKMILRQLLRLVCFSLESDSYFQFS